MIDAEPVAPEASRAVCDWLDARFGVGSCVRLDEIRAQGDAPADVLMWLDARLAWQEAREMWARAQPIDVECTSDRWRMFGGPWLHGWEGIDSLVDGIAHSDNLASLAGRVLARGDAEAFRAWSRHAYEMLDVRRRALQSIADRAESVR